MVAECVSSNRASGQSERIAYLRSHAESLASTKEERAWIRQQIHEPTMSLRTNPGSVNERLVLKDLEEQLLSMRSG